ncbi:protein ALTERED PHOSPHATE STARVATION RESPONSE 1-like [Impatiens glandulifera]|uniref:protein ALTERED PHOSPHATE STARVATION RESPONSE 1-like n=1 Tax=Impatiens glandulifera TaxID=253017 RepID=UPI001FB08E07|nr:protein ALTERED PHOSPHATE STARVATION RESPONSE 1-like [Impatiens glandulifera]
MGCTQSKIDNEETVTRCKERKLFMKDAVAARNAFAAAHAGYTFALKNAGAALSDYSQGEAQQPQFAPTLIDPVLPPAPQPPFESILAPPPLPDFPLQRAASMPENFSHKPDLKHTDPIIEEEEEEEEDEDEEEEMENENHDLKRRTSNRKKESFGRGTDSEGLPPPPLPRTPPQDNRSSLPPEEEWDFFFPPMENVPGANLADLDEARMQRADMERKMYEERKKAELVEDKSKTGGGRRNMMNQEPEPSEKTNELPPQPPPPAAAKPAKKVKQPVPSSDNRRGGKVSFNLIKIFSDLDDLFLKASQSASDVSKMLEANRLHFHSNFAGNQGHIDHSARVMRVITWNKSFKGLPNNADDGKDDDIESEELETHATVLDKMLAWEKKLYDEVKAGEQMKLDYQKKVASLNKLKKHNASIDTLERTKAAVSHLHTRYIVDMQSMDSTVSEINRLRDHQLYPKLVQLVDGMATMWQTMYTYHTEQHNIASALKFVDMSQSLKETSAHHHERTIQLHVVIQEWQLQFEKLIKHQKDYVKSLNSWLKPNLIPIDNNLKEKVSSPSRPQNPPIHDLLQNWNDFLGKLPDELARTSIANFAAVIQTIVHSQEDELKLRARCDETIKEINRKTRQFEDWYRKYVQRRVPPEEDEVERAAAEKELVDEKKLAVETVQKRLEVEEESYRQQCVQVREKSLTSLKTALPELFRVLSEFSNACSEMFSRLKFFTERQGNNART